MYTDFLKPVTKELQDFAKSCNSFCIGANVNFEKEVLVDPNEFKQKEKIALIGVQEFRSLNSEEQEDTDFNFLRTSLYELKKGNWTIPIYDFGDIIASDHKVDSGEVFQKVLTSLLKDQFFVIILGGSPSLGFYQYRAYDSVIKNLHYFTVDEKMRFGNPLHQANDNNYLSKIIDSEPLNLLDFTHIGYQTYFVGQEELDLIEQLNFEALRLGQINQDLKEIEPYTREAHAGLINLSSIEANCYESSKDLTPNGFNSREICGVAKYIGLSSVLSSIYISNYIERYKKVDHLLVSQLIWYLVDGRNHRPERKNFDDTQYFDKIFVPSDVQVFVFYRNIQTDQWWIEINESEEGEGNRIIPCSSQDYTKALEGEIPYKWWKYFKKFY